MHKQPKSYVAGPHNAVQILYPQILHQMKPNPIKVSVIPIL